ncbi:MAG TPA: VOC family protein [Bryobacteraceae bacterium]|jgi:catechol 2,3-dioxygenase-like lactoylglutathione lyase family enzyme
MDTFFGRSVFFVKDAQESLAFYTEKLGFKLEWNHQVEGRAFVFQVSLFGFQLILNQIEDWTKDRAGHGRVFLGVEHEQGVALREHIRAKGISVAVFHWGNPTFVIRDMDGNELFFWLPEEDRAAWESELGERGA